MIGLDSITYKKTDSLLEVIKSFDKPILGKSTPAGIALIVNDNNELIGTVTDGDVRRAILDKKTLDINAEDCMQTDPIFLSDKLSIQEIPDQLAEELEKKGRRAKKFLNTIILVNEKNQPTRLIDYHQLWEQRVATHRHIAILGLGYVGLTLALALADEGYLISGIDVDKNKIDQLRKGDSYIHEVGLPELLREHIGKNFLVSEELSDDIDVFVISVGTPVISKNGAKPAPIMDYLEGSLQMIGSKLKSGNLVILRSTVPIGTCRNFVIPKLEELSGLRCGIDFHVSFAPERTAEGKAIKELRELPQIIGGFNADSIEATAALFRELTPTLVRVESLEAAEMVKLINNSFRDYVFAYSNYLTGIASEFNIDINSVIKAANNGYPRDKVPYPSPGVGGPCLTKDPFIFSGVTDAVGIEDLIFENGRTINESMHDMVVDKVSSALKSVGKDPANANILVCGLAFKGNPETGDIRNSSGVEIALQLKDIAGKVYGYDPVALIHEIEEYGIIPTQIPDAFKEMDAILFLNNHRSFDKLDVFEMIRLANENPIILDGWNQFHAEDILSARPCIYMGLSHKLSSIN